LIYIQRQIQSYVGLYKRTHLLECRPICSGEITSGDSWKMTYMDPDPGAPVEIASILSPEGVSGTLSRSVVELLVIINKKTVLIFGVFPQGVDTSC